MGFQGPMGFVAHIEGPYTGPPVLFSECSDKPLLGPTHMGLHVYVHSI